PVVEYSFPKSGKWSAQKVGSIYLPDVERRVEEVSGKTLSNVVYEEEGPIIKAFFAERFP
ncbi:MAG: hypothetical protein ABIH82_02485, partial [Candidatus Woesearchaeota archaeon]